LESLKNFAKAKEVAALANSEGCIVKLQGHTNNVDQLCFTKRKKSPANDNKETTK
jgi:hypothetical protein